MMLSNISAKGFGKLSEKRIKIEAVRSRSEHLNLNLGDHPLNILIAYLRMYKR